MVGSTQKGLTKAETIQVKGDECLYTVRYSDAVIETE